MKKVSIFFTLFLVLALSGCSLSNSNRVKIENEELKNKVSSLQQQIIDLKQETTELSNVSASTAVAQTNDLPAQNKPTSSENSLIIDETMNGNNLGYITKIYNKEGTEYLTIDYVQWFTSRDAVVASIEDGDCKIEGKTKTQAIAEAKVVDFSMGLGEEYGSCTPNGYYIRNSNPMLRNFKIADNIDIEVQGNGGLQKISLEKLISTIASYDNKENSLFTITLKDNIVIKIQEAYRP